LHDALIGLAHEKPYPSIAVKDILDRANVGRSTFYTHFRDKDDLLESGIHEILRGPEDEARGTRHHARALPRSLPEK
jgi:AcrR family transcriptional regulator